VNVVALAAVSPTNAHAAPSVDRSIRYPSSTPRSVHASASDVAVRFVKRRLSTVRVPSRVWLAITRDTPSPCAEVGVMRNQYNWPCCKPPKFAVVTFAPTVRSKTKLTLSVDRSTR